MSVTSIVYPFPFVFVFGSEGKSVLEDKLSEVSTILLAAYHSGELLGVLEEGHSGWQKWVESFGKSLKRKVNLKTVAEIIKKVR